MNVLKSSRVLWLLLFALLTPKRSSVTAFFEGCDHNYVMQSGARYSLLSNNYPNSYLPGSSCRYQYTAPAHHSIVVTCTLNLDKFGNTCVDSFYIAVDGDPYLRGSEKLCGRGMFSRSSLTQNLVLAYISSGSLGSFICFLHAEPCNCGLSMTRNIANGEETSVNEFPSMVALKTRGRASEFFCSAVIISDRYMVTAAHCALFQEPGNILAWVGKHNINSDTDTIYTRAYAISQRIVHPQYQKSSHNNDIALLQASSSIKFSRGVSPICLPPYSNVNNDFSWQDVEVIGWGATFFSGRPSNTLQKISITVTDTDTCRRAYQNIEDIFPTQICTRDLLRTRKDSCQYDSGGPVILRNSGRQYLVGVISAGSGCATQDDPTGINTRVTSYLSWIHSNTFSSACTVEM